MLGTIAKFPQLVESGCRAAKRVKLELEYCDGGIRFLGLGGSAIGGDIIRDWLGPGIVGGVTVDRNYLLSAPIRKDSLVICCSYSGNTAETLSMLSIALKSKAKNIILISSDGKLAGIARSKHLPFIRLDKVPMPRASLPMVFAAVATVLDRIGTTEGACRSMLGSLSSCRKYIKSELAIGVPTERNPAKQSAHTIYGFVPVAIAPVTIESIARRWKTQMNENAKQHCFYGTFPEITHNEIVPWSRDDRSQGFVAVTVHDLCDNRSLKSGFDRFTETMRRSVRTIDVRPRGKNRIEAMMNNILLADFTSVYSAFLSGVDPTPVEEIVEFKKR